jgi:glycyl-tRNA synthetase beta subunit
MAKLVELDSSKTYKTKENAIKAVEKIITNPALENQRYFITQNNEGRFFPVFIGTDAVYRGIHFHFSVVA